MFTGSKSCAIYKLRRKKLFSKLDNLEKYMLFLGLLM
jgi:hypothetical protein